MIPITINDPRSTLNAEQTLQHCPDEDLRRAAPARTPERLGAPSYLAAGAVLQRAQPEVCWAKAMPAPTPSGGLLGLLGNFPGVGAPPRGYAGGPAPLGETLAPTVALAAKATRAPGPVLVAARPDATAPAVASAATAKASASSSSASSSSKVTARELSFLDSKTMTIEEKLFRFLALMTKKSDQELVDAMKSYAGRFGTSQSSTSGSGASSSSGTSAGTAAPPATSTSSGGGGGGFFGFIGDAIGGAVNAVADGVTSVVKDAGGPLLGAAVTALGFPEFAGIASSLGGDVAGFVADNTIGQLRSSSGSKSSSSSTSKATSSTSTSSGSSGGVASDTTTDEKLAFFDLQRLAEKQTTMFTALSNIMKSMHDAQMAAVQNIR